jgi:uncharacterized phage protein (TIGR01671 family)
MLRSIKFRGRRIDNGEWVYGWLVKYGWTGKEKYYIVPEYASALYADEVDPFTVGEFTGLRDKSGREIYENDIWEDERDKWVWTWIDRYARFVASVSDNMAQCGRIIGNIHENPELLGDTNE